MLQDKKILYVDTNHLNLAGSDFVARLIGLKLTEVLGQSIIIDNRPGAGGLIGAELVARAVADGYTLLLADASFTISPVVNKKSSYHAIKDFAPIALVADTPYVFITPATESASTLLEYVAQARAQPNKISLGSAGNGSGSHLAGELFQLNANLKLIHIPYKSSGQVTIDTMSGQVQSSFATAPSVVQNYKSGKLKILASASSLNWALKKWLLQIGTVCLRPPEHRPRLSNDSVKNLLASCSCLTCANA